MTAESEGRVRLTKAQREMLELAERAPDGNPWPLVSLNRRKGGALTRMFNQMQREGLFDAKNRITPAGRRALETSHDK